MGDKPKCPAGAPMWMVTFADLMALLLTLFVLMLSFAEMDVIKYKAVAGAMKNAFGVARDSKVSGIIEQEDVSIRTQPKNVTREIQPPPTDVPPPDVPFAIDQEPPPEDELLKEVESAIAEELAGQGVDVQRQGNELLIRFPDKLAFGSGSAALNTNIVPALKRIAAIISQHDGEVLVGGHTDDIPISSGRFQSNWDLSASRATAVVHTLLDNAELQSSRVTVQGFADSRPLVANVDTESRAKNRRVEITIVSPDGSQIDISGEDIGFQ